MGKHVEVWQDSSANKLGHSGSSLLEKFIKNWSNCNKVYLGQAAKIFVNISI